MQTDKIRDFLVIQGSNHNQKVVFNQIWAGKIHQALSLWKNPINRQLKTQRKK